MIDLSMLRAIVFAAVSAIATGLSAVDRADLIDYLLQLDGSDQGDALFRSGFENAE